MLGQSLFEFCLTVLAGVPQGGKGSLFPKISCWLLSVKIDKIDKIDKNDKNDKNVKIDKIDKNDKNDIWQIENSLH